MTIVINGDAGNNVINAGSIEDHDIFGLGGNDTLHGNDGNDLLDGGSGSDHMGGGRGNDTYRVDSVGDFVHEAAGEGTDTVEASISYTLASNFENLTLTGVANINATGNTLNNFIVGNSGNNRIDGGGGSDHMHGEAGNDTYVVNSTGDLVHEFLNEGTDTVESSITYTLGAHLENLTLTGAAVINGTGNELANSINGNNADNVLKGLAGNDTMHGNGGNDTLDGGTGDDHMGGGLGNDTYYVDSVADYVHESANQGTDTVFSRASSFTLGSNVENLTLQDASFSIGPGGVILLTPGGVNGTGNSGANTMTGNAQANQLNGMAGDDFMLGGGGNDRLDGGTGNDHMHGDAGNDVYIVDSASDLVHELANEGTDLVEASVSYTISDVDVENLTLTGTGNISGTGNASANVLVGNSGNNTLNGLGGIDTMRGGAGNDRYYVDHASDQVIENAGEGTDTVYASVSETLTDVDVENLTLTGAAATSGTGNASANHIDGNSAANVLRGLAGNDLLHGNGGNDTIEGGTGADEIGGGAGNDVLRAVANVAFVDDGAEDRFVFNTALNAATNVDLIDKATFIAGGGEGLDDEIVLENSIFSALLTNGGGNVGTLGAAYYFEGVSSGNGLFDPVGIYNNTATGQLFYNASFGVAGDSTLFAAVNLAGVAGGSVVLSVEEFSLV